MGDQRPPRRELVAQLGIRDLVTLVFTDGGAPNVVQRKMLTDIPGWNDLFVAVVSSSMLVRGVATTVSWFNPKLKVFQPEDVLKAMEYLALSSQEQTRAWVTLADLRKRFGVRPPRSMAGVRPEK
jgi:hypothetical protein